jgi:hypothetical protein
VTVKVVAVMLRVPVVKITGTMLGEIESALLVKVAVVATGTAVDEYRV